jgi:hypothetical protein
MGVGREGIYGRVIRKRSLGFKTTGFISFTMSAFSTRIGIYNSY